jgi:DNA-binding transcriptional MocR family regulator
MLSLPAFMTTFYQTSRRHASLARVSNLPLPRHKILGSFSISRPAPRHYTVRGIFHLEAIPGMISMLAGKPNPALFPFSSISVNIQIPDGAGHIEKTVKIEGKALEQALQYGPTPGLPGLQKWLKGLQSISHKRPQTADWDLAVGSGSQDLLYKVRLH